MTEHLKEIKSIIDLEKENGGAFWSRLDGDIHAPTGFSAIDVAGVLGELGATATEYSGLPDFINFLFQYQTSEGSFKYSKTSSKLPCMTGRILAALGKLGFSRDRRTEKSYQWLLESQASDGGWRCATVKKGKSPATDASNPGTTLYVLDAFRFRKNAPAETKQLHRGVEFLLRHWVTRKPLGPCEFGIGSRFFKVEYPFLRYNLFYYAYVLSFYEITRNDQRFNEALQYLSEKLKNGKMVVETPHKAWQEFSFARKGKISELATLRWKEIERNLVG